MNWALYWPFWIRINFPSIFCTEWNAPQWDCDKGTARKHPTQRFGWGAANLTMEKLVNKMMLSDSWKNAQNHIPIFTFFFVQNCLDFCFI
jgi:hypothetical protein